MGVCSRRFCELIKFQQKSILYQVSALVRSVSLNLNKLNVIRGEHRVGGKIIGTRATKSIFGDHIKFHYERVLQQISGTTRTVHLMY